MLVILLELMRVIIAAQVFLDEFNNKLLTPELSKKQLEELHSEALTLYKEYLSQDCVNFVGCPDEIVNDYYALIKDGVYNVARLRTSKPLYQAYEHTFTVLEKIWLPSFFHSNEVLLFYYDKNDVF